MTTKPKVIVIVGPTASGKSSLGVALAKKFKGEVISADSRQVYRGMNIGSGKVTKKEMAGVPHHLLDVADPKKVFSVAQYQKLANKSIVDILQRGKLPIVVGGTGFYIQSVVDGLVLPEVAPNAKLRRELSKLTPAELFKHLKKLDPQRAKNIDRDNPVRLIRAIEIAEALGKVPKLKKSDGKYNALQIGIKIDFSKLEEKIHRRLVARLKRGMVAEVKKLHEQGASWKRLEALGLEYRYCALYLQQKISKEEMIAELTTKINQYAKRQMTWFKRDERIKWIEKPAEALSLTKSFLS